jgi:cysteine-rich repeat protein
MVAGGLLLAVACGEDTDGYDVAAPEPTGGRWQAMGGRASQAAGVGGEVSGEEPGGSGGVHSEETPSAGAGGDKNASCGDGHVQPGEECDPGNPRQPPCEADCTLSPVCGNGIVEEDAGEECDDGDANQNNDCLNDCTLPTCGDGILHNLGMGNEWCDDGEDNGPFPARCSATCSSPDGCGNGEAAPGQDCDDGDLNDDLASCRTNCEWNVCGDGYAYLDETPGTDNTSPLHECDDFNEDDADACTSDCAWNVCGDGYVFSKGYGAQYEDADDGNELDDNPNPVEECDDGNDEAGDGCFECLLED